jgi:Spy/CpxP family protein refolding chaperone
MTGKMNRQSVPVGSSKERRNIMKPQIIIGALLAITIGSASAAWADRDCDCRPGGPEWQEGHRPAVRGPGQGNREHEERDFARIGKALILTEAQKAKIEGIVQAERDKSAPLRQKLEDTWKKLRQAEQAAKFDEAAVRTIAASHAQWLTEMMVARARAQNQIHALLTTEQCAIADKLRPPIDDGGPGHFRLPRHESGPGHSRPPRQKSDYGDMPHCGCEWYTILNMLRNWNETTSNNHHLIRDDGHICDFRVWQCRLVPGEFKLYRHCSHCFHFWH